MGVVIALLVLITGCFSVDAPNENLLSMAERLGKLHCISNSYHDEMRPIFEGAKAANLSGDSAFLAQKEKHYQCLRNLNRELIALQNDFDKEMLALGGFSNHATKPYYDRLDLAMKELDACKFIAYCKLNFDFIATEK